MCAARRVRDTAGDGFERLAGGASSFIGVRARVEAVSGRCEGRCERERARGDGEDAREGVVDASARRET